MHERFARDGYVVPVDIFPSTEAPRLLRLYQRLRALLPPGMSTQKMDWWHGEDRELYEICAHPAVLAAVEAVLGDSFYLWGTQFFAKEPGDGKTTPWHQDAFYWPLSPQRSVTVWLAFADTDASNAAMQVIPGSHRAGRLTHAASHAESDVLDMVLEDGQFRVEDAVSLDLQAGQASLHDDNIVHGSGPNNSSRLRCGLTMRYASGDVRCDLSVWPFFAAYWMRGTDNWRHNPAGTPPTGLLSKYVQVAG